MRQLAAGQHVTGRGRAELAHTAPGKMTTQSDTWMYRGIMTQAGAIRDWVILRALGPVLREAVCGLQGISSFLQAADIIPGR